MKTTLEDISPVQKKIKVEVPADIVAQARVEAMQDIQKEAKVEGFRPGKVPNNIIEQRFGHEVEHQTLQKVIDMTLMKAFEETKTYPVSRPEISPGLFIAGGGFSYTATFEVLPTITLTEKDYKGLKLEKEEIEVTAEEIENELKRLQIAMTQLEPMPPETALGEGHVALIDFKGTVDGKPFQGGEATDHIVELGTGETLPEFEKGLKGIKAGEERDLHFNYPKDYFNKDLAGKKAEFKVKAKEIRKKNMPALNDDFAKDLGQFKTLKEVKVDLEKRIAEVKESQQKGALFNQIVDHLIGHIKFEIPQALIHHELQSMLEQFAREMMQRGQKLEDIKTEEVVKEFQPEAEKRVRSFLLLDQVAQKTGVQATDEEVEGRLDAISKQANRPLAEVKAHYEKNNMMASIKNRILHEKSLEFVLNEAKIKEVKPKKPKK